MTEVNLEAELGEMVNENHTADSRSYKNIVVGWWQRRDRRIKIWSYVALIAVAVSLSVWSLSDSSTAQAPDASAKDQTRIVSNDQALVQDQINKAVKAKLADFVAKIGSLEKQIAVLKQNRATVSPEVLASMRKDLDEIKSLHIVDSDKVAELDREVKSFGQKLADALNPISSAHAAPVAIQPAQETQKVAPPVSAPAPAAAEEAPRTKRWLWATAQCKRLDSLPIRDQNTLAQKLEKSTEQGAVDWIKDCNDPSGAWRQFAYYGVNTTPKTAEAPEEQTALYYPRRYRPVQPAPMYEGDRKLLRLNSLGPRGDVITDRPAPVASIPCIVKGVRGHCVPK